MQPDSELPRQTVPDGRYSNFFRVGYNAFEFLLDFGQNYTDSAEDSPHTRIVMLPAYAQALSELLLESLRHYESNHGEIPKAAEASPLEKVKKYESAPG
jgi:hypothetical protein